MTEADRLERNRLKLLECHPSFRKPLARMIADLEAATWRPRIQQAWRSPADQLVAFQTGHSELEWGLHNATSPDGQPEAFAADVLDDDHPLNPSRVYLWALAREAHKQGLMTGITFGLPASIKAALADALVVSTSWEGKVGWDPTHVQIASVSVQAIHNGYRPLVA